MAEEDDSEQSRFLYNIYIQHRRDLILGKCEQYRSFDKNILTLASGGLGLSIIFVQHVAPKPVCWSFPFLILTWVCLLLSILSTLISFLTSQEAFEKRIADLDKQQSSPEQGSESAMSPNDSWSSWTRRFNIASLVTFWLGVVFFTVFAAPNITYQH